MLRTRVGYSGGDKPDPTYRSLGEHTESIQIDFDPRKVSYEQLLGVALKSGNFTGSDFSRQYRSVVFYHNKKQLETARKLGIKKLEPLAGFTRAEDYHQKYYLQQSSVAEEFYKRYPTVRAFTDSTAVTRANGMAGGHVSRERIRQMLPQLGVSQAAGERLLKMAGKDAKGCGVPAGILESP